MPEVALMAPRSCCQLPLLLSPLLLSHSLSCLLLLPCLLGCVCCLAPLLLWGWLLLLLAPQVTWAAQAGAGFATRTIWATAAGAALICGTASHAASGLLGDLRYFCSGHDANLAGNNVLCFASDGEFVRGFFRVSVAGCG